MREKDEDPNHLKKGIISLYHAESLKKQNIRSTIPHAILYQGLSSRVMLLYWQTGGGV